MFGRIVFWVICVFTAFVSLLQARLYLLLRENHSGPGSVQSALDFVEHSIMALWLVTGMIVVGCTNLNDWWSIAWLFSAGGVGIAFQHLMGVSSLVYLADLGTITANEIAAANVDD